MVPLIVNIPAPKGQQGSGTPTGISFNGNPKEFLIAPGKQAIFIFVTEDGTIAAWNPGVDMTNARIVKDNSCKGAVYKGVTIGEIGENHFLFVSNFHSGRIEVYDTNFKPVSMPAGAFTDPTIPAGFAPFNVLNIDGNLFVSFAMQKQPDRKDDAAGLPSKFSYRVS